VKVRRHSAPVAQNAPEADDARAFALELAGLRPGMPIDTMALGLVLDPGEVGNRVVPLWLRMRVGGNWGQASWSQGVVTDRRLLVRLHTGELVSLWWGSLLGFEVDLVAGHVVLDFGDGRPRLLSGPGVELVAVAGIAAVYGVEALASHPALAPLRSA
jgi:hypothetical protein